MQPIPIIPIPIIYEEPHFLLVNKPAALFSQAPVGIDSLQTRLVNQLKQRDQHPGEPFIGLPHRLDRGTSGIMLIARNQRALKRFGEQFQSRKVIKHYLAVVEGEYSSTAAPSAQVQQRWEDYLRKIPDKPQAEVVAADVEGAKLAVANVECLQIAAGQSLLRVQLETGRMHQIRIQAASRGLPVVGDASYGAKLTWQATAEPCDPSQVTPLSDTPRVLGDAHNANAHLHPPVALHAWSLEFRHPQTAKSMRLVAPVPPNWQQLPTEILACIDAIS